MLTQFLGDQTGFIVSAELVLVATLLVIGLIVGLSEVQHAVNAELNDVADAIGSANQTYFFGGFRSFKRHGFRHGFGIKSSTAGSAFMDLRDECDNDQCAIDCVFPTAEAPKWTCGTCAGTCAGY